MKCTDCQMEKPQTDFYKTKNKKGHTCRCKVCHCAKQKEWQQKNAAKVKNYAIRYRMSKAASMSLWRLIADSLIDPLRPLSSPKRDNRRRCTTCGVYKTADSFYRSKRALEGHEWRCKSCRDSYSKAWIEKNPDKALGQRRAYLSRKSLDCKTLSDKYISYLIRQRTPIPRAFVTNEIIELKRVELQIKRQLKEMK